MEYCNYCKVHIRGNGNKCPLCMNILPDDTSGKEAVYPDIPPTYERHMATRIAAFISIAAIVGSFTISKLFTFLPDWSSFVLLGLISMWLILVLVVRKRHNIAKDIMWQVTIISLLSIAWDFVTGWRNWSLEYLIPIVSVSAMLVMYITAKAMKLSISDYVAYLLLIGLFGIIPILFILFDWINVKYPSVICVAASIIFLSAVMIFHGENIIIELKKRMHV